MMVGSQNAGKDAKDSGKKNEIKVQEVVTNMFSTMNSNDLASLKKYLDGGADGISDYTNAIEYSYSVTPQIYREDGDSIRQVHPDQSFRSLGLGASSNGIMSSMMSTNVFLRDAGHGFPVREPVRLKKPDTGRKTITNVCLSSLPTAE